jgi:hypothetical protein
LGSERGRCEKTDKNDERCLSGEYRCHLCLVVPQIHIGDPSKNLAECGFIPLKDAVRRGLTRNSLDPRALGTKRTILSVRIRSMAMTICCDFRAIDGDAKASAGAAHILGGLLLLIAP